MVCYVEKGIKVADEGGRVRERESEGPMLALKVQEGSRKVTLGTQCVQRFSPAPGTLRLLPVSSDPAWGSAPK